MLLNGKSYKHWTKEDLLTLLNNDDFREGQFLDYKRTFDFLETSDKKALLKMLVSESLKASKIKG